MKEITLTKGYVALVDDENYDEINQYSWFVSIGNCNKTYAATGQGQSRWFMHEMLLQKPEGFEIDHKDGDGLNNQKYNLRLATVAQNRANRKMSSNNTSGYKGVCFSIKQQKWMSYIKINRVRKHLGSFDTKEEAAERYNRAAKHYFGEFALLNAVIK